MQLGGLVSKHMMSIISLSFVKRVKRSDVFTFHIQASIKTKFKTQVAGNGYAFTEAVHTVLSLNVVHVFAVFKMCCWKHCI